MKIVIVAVAGLVLGVGAGAAVGGLQVKGRILEEHAKAAADSAAAAEAGGGARDGDATPTLELPPEESGDSSASPLGDATLPDLGGSPDSALASAEGASPPPAGSTPDGAGSRGAPALDVEGARKLAKIFGAMKPADAAAVLAEMSDAEVRAVLMQMSDRQAAPILGAFPAARAAALSREVLQIRAGA